MLHFILRLLVVSGFAALTACGGGGGTTTTYSTGGNVTGLVGNGLILQNSGRANDNLAISADGSFTFTIEENTSSTYNVTVVTQPTNPAQICSVTSGIGVIGSADITDVVVSCIAETFTVGGTVSGLMASGLMLQNNSGDDLAIIDNGTFSFVTALEDLSAYSVTVLTQPNTPNQTCSVTSGSGNLAGANESSIAINCVTNTYTVAVTVSGLSGSGLVLQNNGGDNL
ncbi:MAG: hypothetical protein KAU21_03925, partial [Gammaproteobacteria bacterium]|nr:hypothetical protein [Gammaproteobacteria bacterium]